MTTYGVVPTGFKSKPLADTLADLEQANSAPDAFGDGLIQTAQTPMGQLNGLRSDAITEVWEVGNQVFAANDPDQTEGANLDRIGQIRLIERQPDETDADYAQAITNQGVARIRDADFFRDILAVDGVTWALVYSNDTGTVDSRGLDPHSVSVSAIGGSDEELAVVARPYIAGGIGQSGNTAVETLIDGQCRTVRIQRPSEIDGTLRVTVNKTQDAAGCPPPSNNAIAEALIDSLTGMSRPANATTLTLHRIRTALSLHPNVEITAATWEPVGGSESALPIVFDYDNMPRFSLDNIIVTAAS